jgi:hypothetical protein
MKKGCFSRTICVVLSAVIIFSSVLMMFSEEGFINNAFAGSSWVQTTQGDFLSGTLEDVTVTPEGNVTLTLPSIWGNLTSAAFDCGGDNIKYKTINWTENLPPGCDITFQLRTADTQANLSLKDFVGPDGSNATHYLASPGVTIFSGHDGERWIQYRANLTGTGAETPTLEHVRIYYNFIPDIPVLLQPGHDIWISDPTPFFNWSYSDTDGIQDGFQLIIDSDPAFGSIDYDSGMQSQPDTNWQFPWGTAYTEVMDGIWFWKVRVQDDDGDWSQYTMERIIKIDTTPPTSVIDSPLNNSYLNSFPGLSGTAGDGMGSGLFKIETCILRVSDGQYWNGTTWVPLETWLSTSGLSSWSKSTELPTWETGTIYNIKSRGTDNISNEEIPGEGSTFVFDLESPTSFVDIPFEGVFLKDLSSISGTSFDTGGAFVDIMEITLKRNSDNMFWNGSAWEGSESWLQASGTTSWSYTSSFPSWDNGVNYTVTSRATDAAGNMETPSSNNTFTIDALAPEAPMQVLANPIDWTNNNSFEVDWINPPEVSGVKDGAYYKLNSPPTFETDGTWKGEQPLTNISVPGDGAHEIYVWLEDDVGNINHLNYNTTFLYFDSEVRAPTSPLVTPSGWTNSNSFIINWTDPADLSGMKPGAYYKLDSPPTSNSDGIWQGSKPITGITVSGDGVHTLYIWLEDNAGNINYLNYTTTLLYYDFEEPGIPTDLLATPENWVNVNSFSLSWVNPADISNITGVYYKFDTLPAHDSDGTFVAGDNIQQLSDIQVPSQGDHDIFIWLVDDAGNIQRFNYNTTTLHFDSEILQPTSLTPTPNFWTNINSFDLSWINPPDSSGISGAYYKMDSPPTSDSDGTLVTGDDLELLSGITVQEDGEHLIYLWLLDYAGNANHTNHVTTTVFYDSQSPEPPKELLVDPSTWTSQDSFSIDWVLPSESGTSGIKTGIWYKMGDAPTANEDGTWISEKPFSISDLPEGETPLYVWLEDFAGNKDHTNHILWILRHDITKPVVTITAPLDGEWSNQSSYLVTWTGDDSHSDIVKYEIKRNSAPFSDIGPAVQYLFESLIPGKHDITVMAVDSAGNTNSSSISLFIDKNLPTVTITSPDDYQEFDTRMVEIRWAASDSSSGMHHYEIRLDEGDFIDLGLVKNHTFSDLSDGTHNVFVRGFDKAQNWKEFQVSFNVSIYVVPDTDGDGLNDTVDTDDDNDGLPDTWENQYGLNRLDASDAALDSDSDGLNNTKEFEIGTEPDNEDTDGDGHNDGDDYYPTDPGKWKKETAEEDSPILIILIVVMVIIVLLLLFLKTKRKSGGLEGLEGLEYESLEEEKDVEVSGESPSEEDSLGVEVDHSEEISSDEPEEED